MKIRDSYISNMRSGLKFLNDVSLLDVSDRDEIVLDEEVNFFRSSYFRVNDVFFKLKAKNLMILDNCLKQVDIVDSKSAELTLDFYGEGAIDYSKKYMDKEDFLFFGGLGRVDVDKIFSLLRRDGNGDITLFCIQKNFAKAAYEHKIQLD